MSISYEVILTVRADLVAAWEKYLPGHTAEVMATGCFQAAEIERDADGRYRCRYTAPNKAMLDRYLTDHAPRLRADALAKFPDGVETARAVWSTVRHFDG
jgi:uncharacterized protein DUF4286